MKKHSFKRCAAALASLALMASAMPAVQFAAEAAETAIVTDDFSSGVKGWGTYKETGGKCDLTSSDGKLALTVSNVGEKNYSVQFFYNDVIKLYENGVYRLKFDISCTTERYVEAMIQQNSGTYQAYTWKGLTIGPEVQSVDYKFTMEKETDIMSKFCFNCGNEEKDGDLPEHTIYLDNVSLELVDDSNVNYTAEEAYEAPIITNQVGYRPDSSKMVLVRGDSNATKFKVVNDTDKSVVFTGDLGAATENKSAGETDRVGDFSTVKDPGTYHIEVEGLDNSYSFTIRDQVYDGLIDETVKMLYLQRCGCEVKDKTFGHAACHTEMATVYGTNEKIDVSGGWHDAGDYGRYVVPAAKTIADLLYAYGENPSAYGDNIGIAESGNGTPDVLDEARYELEWMLKMQRADGGVYHKVSCATFPGFVMPEDETDPLIVTPVSTTATANFAASMALAYEYYKSVDATFANKCLDAAKSAWKYLESNTKYELIDPRDEIVTGDYADFFKDDSDERYWAACQLYRSTGEKSYLDAAEKIGTKNGFGWVEMGDYGNIALLTMKDADKSSTAYTKAAQSITSQADKLLKTVTSNTYGSSITKYEWGSNMTIANNGIILSLAYKLTGNVSYKDAAERQLDYLLGENPLGTCFVTGWGTVSPQHPHHRPSVAKAAAMPGMLVGGVDQSLEDDAAKAFCADAAPARCWVDNDASYSTNEITIYWNSPLTYLLTLTGSDADVNSDITPDPDGVLWGDANVDNKVTVADAVAILQFLGNPDKYPLKAQGKINGDVFNNGDGITAKDALSIQKLDAGQIKSLPESYKNGQPAQPDQPDQPVQTTAKPVETTTESATTTTKTTPTTTTPVYTTTEATTTTTPSNPSSIPVLGTPMDKNATMVSDFTTGDAGDFYSSEGWTNGKPFDCWWYKENSQIVGDHLELKIAEKYNAADKNPDWNPSYSGGEFRTDKYYHYGYYETSMQAIKNDGVVSSFFTYTGPSDVINDVKNPWDEIDIEILGKDTTKVQLNYYKDGVGGHEKMIDLGFDASEAYHTYGFDWQPDHITWYIDGKEVWTMKGDMPVTPSKIMMNAWPGLTVDDWLKPYDGNKPLTARYQWVTYKQADGAKNPRTLEEIEKEAKAGSGNNEQQPTNPSSGQQGAGGIADLGTPMNSSAKMVSDFRTGKAGDFFASSGWTNGKPFDCWWYKQNAQIVNDHLELKIDKKYNADDKNPDWNPQYSGGEFRTNEFYHYGYYETSMQAIKNDGVVSSFFTYTGPSDVVNGKENPWDEIDIEILGKDTTKVQLNYYTSGVGKHEKMIDLGFDASEAYHTYGFDWQPGKITWYIDGKEVYSATENIPVTPQKIMMNAWPGLTVDDWLKAYNGNTPLTARYQWVTYNDKK